MVEITVMLFGKRVHFFTHLEAVIKDLETGRSFYINYPSMETLNDSKKNTKNSTDSASKYSNFASQVTLYSDGNLDNFIDSYYHEFGDKGKYCFPTYNCSSAVNFALDYFFPEETILKLTQSITQSLFCCFSLACCCASCCPMPLGIDAPADVFRLAKRLSKIYGIKNKELKQVADEKDTRCNTSNFKEMKNSKNCFNALTLAIINDEQDLIMHFIEHHFSKLTEKQIVFSYLCCVAVGNDDIAKLLVKKKPDCFKKENGKTQVYQSFSEEEVNILLTLSIENNADFRFIKDICKYHSGFFMRIERRRSPAEKSYIELAYYYNRPDVVEYFINEHAKWFTPLSLGYVLICLIIDDKYDLALSLLKNRSDVYKNNWQVDRNYMQHFLMKKKQDPFTLFSLLCESKPVADLTLKNKDGQTVLDIAIKNHHVRVVNYIFENHRDKLSWHELAAASKFLSDCDVHHKRNTMRM